MLIGGQGNTQQLPTRKMGQQATDSMKATCNVKPFVIPQKISWLPGQIQQKQVDICNIEKELADKRAMRVQRNGASLSAKLRAKLECI